MKGPSFCQISRRYGSHMRFSARSLIVILLSFTFLVGHCGCAVQTPYILPPTPPEEVKAQLGAVGVVSACFPPEITFREPMGKGAGMATGAAGGALITIGLGVEAGAISIVNPLVSLFCVAAGVALAPAGAVVGGVWGAAEGVSPEKRKAARETLDAACMGVKFQEMMRDCVIQVVREQTHRPLIVLGEGSPTADGEQVSYRNLGAKAIDTVLEVSVLKFGLEGKGINPPLALTMTERTRLIRAADGKVLYDHRLTYSGAKRKFVDWSTDNAQPLREELERCCRHLAERIIEEAFLLYVPGESEEYRRGEWSAEGLKK